MIKCVLAVEKIKVFALWRNRSIGNFGRHCFGAWDVYPANAYESAVNAEVLQEKDILPVKEELER